MRDDLASNRDHDVFDIVIAGASFAGLALARALSVRSQGHLKMAIVDPTDAAPTNARSPAPARNQPRSDARAFALSASSRYLLERISVWSQLSHAAQSVTHIKITDSSLEAGVRPVLMAWDNLLKSGDPASFIVPAAEVLDALLETVRADKTIVHFRPCSIASIEKSDRHHTVRLSDGRSLSAKLVVAADGQKSPLRNMAGIDVVRWAYDQRGIVTTIAHNKPHHATAVQHFLPSGPFAMLPLRDNRTCITWSETTSEAERILGGDDAQFLDELDQRIAGRLGSFEVVGPRQSWPLSMHLARSYIADRFALIGDAAHGVHPLAGQGLNLGLRDVAALADVVVEAGGLGLDIGRLDVLQRYERWRRSDSALSAASFDGINRLFSNDAALLRSLREVGLGAVDRLQGLKNYFVGEAAGQAGDVPMMMQKDVA